jgi:MFS family permease
VSGPERLPIKRNTALLSGALAANSGMLQLSAAVASLTLVSVVGLEGLLGLGPAIVLAAGALAALPAGRAMDRVGRVPVLAGGFAAGAAGCCLAALGATSDSTPAVLLGLLGVGAAGGIAMLARAAAGDMYPPERRARGIALVLFGAVFGAILGPAVFSPLLRGRDLDGDSLALLWLAAAGFMAVGLALVLAVRPDPKRIAAILHTTADPPPATTASLGELIRRPGVIPALLAGQASFAVMVGLMTLTGVVVVDHQGHAGHNVFPIIGAHVVGLYALVLVVGDLIDRSGRRPAGDGAGVDQPAVDRERPGHGRGAVRAGHRLEPLVRRRDGPARRRHPSLRARAPAGLQRPAGGPHRRGAGADRRRGAVHHRRRRAGDRRRGARRRPGAVDPAPAYSQPDRRKRTYSPRHSSAMMVITSG